MGTVRSKGERLGWPFLEESKSSSKLTPEMVKGEKLTERQLKERGRLNDNHVFLVP